MVNCVQRLESEAFAQNAGRKAGENGVMARKNALGWQNWQWLQPNRAAMALSWQFCWTNSGGNSNIIAILTTRSPSPTV
jgi:hypothetical protein